MTELAFEEATHTYTLGGSPLPSVTQALRTVFGASPYWSPEARQLGLDVHLAIQLHEEGSLDEWSLDSTVFPYYQAYIDFKAETRAHVLASEIRVAHAGLGYAGTIDTIMSFSPSGATVLDIKSGQPEPWHALQVTAYAMAYRKWANIPDTIPIYRACLYLEPGKYRLVRHQNPADETAWLCALTLSKWMNNA